MTKVFALLSIAAVFAFASCAEKTPEVSDVDTTVVVPADTTPVAPMADTTAADTTAKVEAPAAH